MGGGLSLVLWMQIFRETLGNGITAVVLPARFLESVSIAVGIRYGLLDGRSGLGESAHFLEHMLFRGTRKRTTKQIHDEERDIGATLNAETDYESTTYYIKSHKERFAQAIDLLSDLVKNSTLPSKAFELERGAITNETLIHYDNPIFFTHDYFAPILFKNHLRNIPPPGDTGPIKRQTRKDLLDIYKSQYVPRNISVVIYGGVDLDDAKEQISHCFGDMARRGGGRSVKRASASDRQEMKETVFERTGTKQARIAIGFKTCELRSTKEGFKEELALRVAANMLSNRLFDQVRDKRGLSYDQTAFRYVYDTFGFVAAEVGTELKNLELVKKIILKEYGRLNDCEFSASEIERTKNSLRMDFALQREDTLGMADTLAFYQTVFGSTGFLESFEKDIMKVSMEDVSRACQKYIDVDKYTSCVLKPADKKQGGG